MPAPALPPAPAPALTLTSVRTPAPAATRGGSPFRLAGGGTVAAGRPIGSALSRTWWPIAIPAATAFPKLRRPVAALIVAPPLLDWVDRRPPLDPARYVAARLLDDAANRTFLPVDFFPPVSFNPFPSTIKGFHDFDLVLVSR